MAKQGTPITSKSYLKPLLNAHNLYVYNILRYIYLFLFSEKDLFDFAMFSDNNALNKLTKIIRLNTVFCNLI